MSNQRPGSDPWSLFPQYLNKTTSEVQDPFSEFPGERLSLISKRQFETIHLITTIRNSM